MTPGEVLQQAVRGQYGEGPAAADELIQRDGRTWWGSSPSEAAPGVTRS